MMTNKERYIQACKELIFKYRNPEGQEFFKSWSCPMCKIVDDDEQCRGCPLANKHATVGCNKFESFQAAKAGDYEARAQFFEKIIPILKKWSEERFTRKGWVYSGDEIPREW